MLTNLQSLQSCYSDMYKDCYGVRPRHATEEQWHDEEYLKKQISYLESVLVQVMQEEREQEQRCIVKFEEVLNNLIAIGAKTRDNALRWLFESENTKDKDEICYIYGLPYKYLK